MTHSIRRRTLLTGAAGLGASLLTGRPGGAPWLSRAAAAPARFPVVAAENFYGDVVGQIAGDHVLLTSIISDPNADPHEYGSSTRDMAAIGRARLVIINGLGYDGFMLKLIKAAPNPQREVMDVAHLAGKKEGDNWHIWYDPAVILKFARAVTGVFVRVDAPNARSYQDSLLLFDASYRPFTDKIAAMRARFGGTPIGATEPIFENMAAALDFKILTTKEFQKSVEEGEDPPARAIAEMEDQIRKHAIKVLIYNVQTVSPVTARIRKDAGRLGVPVVGVSETLPPGLSYQRWMLKQSDELEQALAKQP
ncbi:MAG TPA: zinc ABC transporter substrate-binding protein [bacterium]|nr:zinc ABC transporter substrate-binding protein [bacterium]